ncbi:MAG: HAD-IC family P-type ATPase [bacterium]
MKKDLPEKGLTKHEAKSLLVKYGANEIERKRELPALKILVSQFKSPLIYILFFAGVVTLFLGKTADSTVIFLAVFVNTALGFFQETKAEKSLIALRKLIVPQTFVLRDGREEQIEASQLVPGDLVALKTGEKIPADGLVVEAVVLHVNEAILTGESLPVQKSKEQNEVYMGAVIVSGRGKMLVTKTGMSTKMGQIAGGLLETIEEDTPLKKKITRFSKTLTYVFSAICVLIFVEGIYRGRGFLEMFELVVATAVAAIPEGLVITMTVILSLGMQRLLKHKALVRKLLAAETLGGVSVICADKTGTLTEGVMRVVKSDFVNPELGLRASILCNNLTYPLELAMWDWAKAQVKDGGITRIAEANERLDEIPFSSKNKYFAALYENELFVSGAPEKIMAASNMPEKEKEECLKRLDNYTSSGLRVISFAFLKSDNSKYLGSQMSFLRKADSSSPNSLEDMGLNWLGMLAFEDPVRVEVKQALNACKKAGIDIKVVTGDYKETAVAVLRKLDLIGKGADLKVLEGYELSKMTNEELAKRVGNTVLFVRTNPEDKIRIVEALQKNGEVVAMMGDGVNDALALKRADIGVVVGNASEVAKETADMVLLDSNFSTIVAAVNEGRVIFENIRKVMLYLLSDSFTEVILISAALFLGTPLPILAVQILWINLIEDGLPGLALAFEPEEEGLMREPPKKKTEPILNVEVKVLVFIIGIVTDLFLLGLFLFLLRKGLNLPIIRTIVFAGLAVDSLLYVFSCKSLRRNLWQGNPFSNKFLNVSVLIGFLMLFLGIYLPALNGLLGTVPLAFGHWVLIMGLGIANILVIEAVKWVFIRKG